MTGILTLVGILSLIYFTTVMYKNQFVTITVLDPGVNSDKVQESLKEQIEKSQFDKNLDKELDNILNGKSFNDEEEEEETEYILEYTVDESTVEYKEVDFVFRKSDISYMFESSSSSKEQELNGLVLRSGDMVYVKDSPEELNKKINKIKFW